MAQHQRAGDTGSPAIQRTLKRLPQYHLHLVLPASSNACKGWTKARQYGKTIVDKLVKCVVNYHSVIIEGKIINTKACCEEFPNKLTVVLYNEINDRLDDPVDARCSGTLYGKLYSYLY